MGEFLRPKADNWGVDVLLFLPIEAGCLSLVPVLGQTPPGLVEEQHPAGTLEDGPEQVHSSHQHQPGPLSTGDITKLQLIWK